jgi:hypothetical protein
MTSVRHWCGKWKTSDLGFYFISNYIKVRVKISRYRLRQVFGAPGRWDSRISRQSAHEGGKVVSPKHRPPLPPGRIPGTHFCNRLSRPQGHNASGRIKSLKISSEYHIIYLYYIFGLKGDVLQLHHSGNCGQYSTRHGIKGYLMLSVAVPLRFEAITGTEWTENEIVWLF